MEHIEKLIQKAQEAKANGDYNNAIGLYKETIECLPPELEQVKAICFNNLALLYFENAQFNDAEYAYNQALEVIEGICGTDHPDVASMLCNIAVLYKRLGKLEKAEDLYNRALTIDEEAFGMIHPNVARDLNGIATLYKETDRSHLAEGFYRRVLKIDLETLGPDHPSLSRDYNNLGRLLFDSIRIQGNDEHDVSYTECEEMYDKAIAIGEKYYGPMHPELIMVTNNIALLYFVTKRYEKAEIMFKKCQKISEDTFGVNHPHVAMALSGLGMLYRETERKCDAIWVGQRALEIDEEIYGNDHPEVAMSLNNLALSYAANNEYDKAKSVLEKAFDIIVSFSRKSGFEHPLLHLAAENYADILLKNNYSENDAIKQVISRAPEFFNN